jgi:hypothetical protein
MAKKMRRRMAVTSGHKEGMEDRSVIELYVIHPASDEPFGGYNKYRRNRSSAVFPPVHDLPEKCSSPGVSPCAMLEGTA